MVAPRWKSVVIFNKEVVFLKLSIIVESTNLFN